MIIRKLQSGLWLSKSSVLAHVPAHNSKLSVKDGGLFQPK